MASRYAGFFAFCIMAPMLASGFIIPARCLLLDLLLF